MENNSKSSIICALCIAAGLVILGLMLPQAARVFRSYERTVTVKGLCEKEVPADKAIWPIVYKVMGDDLNILNKDIESNKEFVVSFLKDGGIDESDISVGIPSISDKYAQEYGDNNRLYRYLATCTITVCSKDVDKVLALMKDQSKLLDHGIIATSDWESKPQFLFEGLNEIKPEMIEEATKNARLSGDKFAKDSGSRLGKIKTASQGTFTIEDRDANTPEVKKVRVVSSVVYYLSR